VKEKLKILLLLIFFTSQIAYSQWVQQSVPVTKPILAIKFIDTLNGWASTGTFNVQDTGYILHTTNGGINWFIQLSLNSIAIPSLAVINQNLIYAAANHNDSAVTKLYKSTNGGINWSYTTMVPNMYISDMQFINKDSAWECGLSAGPDVRTTTDGGLTWTVRTNGITSNTNRLFFTNYNTGWCGGGFKLFFTTNAGLNWTQIGDFTAQIGSVHFYNLNIGWVGLGNDRLVHTTNGGLNWTYQTLPQFCCGTTTDLYFYDSLKGWGGNRGYKIIKTIDGGLNWGYQIDSGTSYSLSFIDSTTGWTGSDLGIYKTINGGGPITYTGIIISSNTIPENYKLFQRIYDVLGKEIWNSNNTLNAGTHELNYDANNLSSGTYFYRITAIGSNGNIVFSDTKKMILIK
jgi:photosystem II stability/assembly factor-like uncharacterized protein